MSASLTRLFHRSFKSGIMCKIIQKKFSILGKYTLKDCSSTTAPALSYYRPSLDICVVLIRPPWMVEVQILQEQISARPSVDICVVLLPAIRPTWMWEVWKMHGSIFNHGSICSFEESLHCYEISGLLHD